MKEYTVTIETLSDTMLGSGESMPGFIDNDVKYDDNGLPYMFAKTLKGHIREQMEMLVCFSNDHGKPRYCKEDVDDLLGPDEDEKFKKYGRLKFTNVELESNVRKAIVSAIRGKEVSASEILEAMTMTYSSTRIAPETGVAMEHSLRRERMVRTGFTFETKLYLEDEGLDEDTQKKYEKLIIDSFRALQHIGTHKSKGKGHVNCEVKP